MRLQAPRLPAGLEHFRCLGQLQASEVQTQGGYTFRNLASKIHVFADFIVVITHAFPALAEPERAQSVRARRVISQVHVAESSEGMEPSLVNCRVCGESGKGYVAGYCSARAASLASAKDEAASAVADVSGKLFRDSRMKINDAISVHSLTGLSPNLRADFGFATEPERHDPDHVSDSGSVSR
jgi:hypothetical protein